MALSPLGYFVLHKVFHLNLSDGWAFPTTNPASQFSASLYFFGNAIYCTNPRHDADAIDCITAALSALIVN